MGTLIQDMRYGLRMLGKNPGFTAVAVVTLALGIGANTALFSVVNGVLLHPLPFNEPDRLLALYAHTKEFDRSSISYPNFLDWVRNNHSFSAMAAFRQDDFELTGMGEPERVKVEMVSAAFFPLLGVKPVIGRTFLADEDQVGANPVALLGGGFWKRKFGSSPDAVGKTLTLNSKQYTIVGVIPGNFHYCCWNFDKDTDLFVPIGQWNDPTFRDRRTGMGMDAVGRLKPGVTQEQAQADMKSVAANLAAAFPEADKDSGVAMLPLKQNFVGNVEPFLLVLLAAVSFVLLIACANVANLLLARSTTRKREFAIRAALGAGQSRVVRQLLTESVLLSLAGGGLGLLLAAWGTRAALAVLPESLPRAEEVHLDATVLLFTLGISLLVGILFGLIPALKTALPGVHETLKESGRGLSGANHRTQNALVAGEMALALVLLSGAGLMIRSLYALWGTNPGFDPQNVLHFAVASSRPFGATPQAIRAAMIHLDGEFAAVPGVQAATLSVGSLPMRSDSELPFWVEGQPKPASQNEMKSSLFYAIQPDYLKVMRIPLKRGRFLTPEDNEHSSAVMVIDEQFARQAFGGQDPIGKRVNLEIVGTTPEIVGVVGHIKQWGLDEGPGGVQAQLYFPISQIPDQFLPLFAQNVEAMVRTEGPPAGEVGALRQAVQKYNSQMVLYGAQPMEEIISESLASRRFSMILLGVFAALAMGLSGVGIYGVISYVASQRTQEIGIRMALGAQPKQVLQMVLRQGIRVALVGVLAGVGAGLALTRLMANMIYGVSVRDPLTFIGVATMLLLVALAACYVPARRATRIDPVVALRYE